MISIRGGAPQLRSTELSDLDEVLRLAVAFYAEDGFTTSADQLRRNLLTLLPSDATRTTVIDLNGQLVAFAITTTSFGLESGLIAELEDLYVVPQSRRRGLAGQLIEDSAVWARAQGCHQLGLVVAPHGRDLRELQDYYRARGFRDDGRRLLSRPL